jgi:hypothetical protein
MEWRHGSNCRAPALQTQRLEFRYQSFSFSLSLSLPLPHRHTNESCDFSSSSLIFASHGSCSSIIFYQSFFKLSKFIFPVLLLFLFTFTAFCVLFSGFMTQIVTSGSGWPQTHGPSLSASQMWGLQTCATSPSFLY